MKASASIAAKTAKTYCVSLRQVWSGCEIEANILDAETAFTLNRFPVHKPPGDSPLQVHKGNVRFIPLS
jgi:hypothetical protein